MGSGPRSFCASVLESPLCSYRFIVARLSRERAPVIRERPEQGPGSCFIRVGGSFWSLFTSVLGALVTRSYASAVSWAVCLLAELLEFLELLELPMDLDPPSEAPANLRQTKIVATLGPASDALIGELIAAGVDVFRLNFSHGNHDEHARRIQQIRNAAGAAGRFVAILGDLQGPKIRIQGFAGTDTVELVTGRPFTIDTRLGPTDGDATRVGTSYKTLADEVAPGDVLVLGDGLLELTVASVASGTIACQVTVGGELGANKGINKRGGGLSAPALTEKDHEDLRFACAQGVDYLAVSFPRSAEDMEQARSLVAEAGAQCGLVAKLERSEAVSDPAVLDKIILASDAVMVARGDLGIEIGDAQLMGVQKQIIARARALDRSVITATQMMESMIEQPRPTRAEVMDVANAVLDGTDAVMLSGETAVGRYPVDTVRRMVRIVGGAETTAEAAGTPTAAQVCTAIDQSIAAAAITVAEYLERVRAVACLTATGNTPRLMARMRKPLPIYAMGTNRRTLARVALYRGVHPVFFEAYDMDHDLVNDHAVRFLKEAGAVEPGDRVIISKGDYRNVQGGTNTLKILEVI